MGDKVLVMVQDMIGVIVGDIKGKMVGRNGGPHGIGIGGVNCTGQCSGQVVMVHIITLLSQNIFEIFTYIRGRHCLFSSY